MSHSTILPKSVNFYHLNILGVVGVPLFFMISGALLLNRDENIGIFLKKRFLRILYPFLFWIPLTIITGYFLFNLDIHYLYKILVGNNKYTWFVYAIIGIYLLIPVLNPFINRYGQKGIVYLLIIWFITIIFSTFNIKILPSLNLDNFAGYIGFCVLGYFLANYDFKFNIKKAIIISLFMIICFTGIYIYLRLNSIPIGAHYLNIFVVLMSLSIFLFFRFSSDYSFEINKRKIIIKIKNFYEKLVFSLSSLSYSIYFSHIIILHFLSNLPIMKFKWFFLLTIILSWLLSYIMSKIPFVNKISV